MKGLLVTSRSLIKRIHQNLLKKSADRKTKIMARANLVDNILQNLAKEYENLSAIYVEKCQLLNYLDNLQFMKRQSEKKPEKGLHAAEIIVNAWIEELDYRKEKGDDIVMGLLSEVLQEAKAFKASRKGDDGKLEADSNGGDNKRTTSLDNSCIDAGFQKLCITDARIMKNYTSAKKLELNFVHTSVIDYLAAIVPLLQTNLRMTIEEKAEEFVKRE